MTDSRELMTRLFGEIEWKELPAPEHGEDGLPYATHEGTMQIGGVELRVYQLSDGQRVIDVDDAAKLFGVWGVTP
jgi:hypothetical protein